MACHCGPAHFLINSWKIALTHRSASTPTKNVFSPKGWQKNSQKLDMKSHQVAYHWTTKIGIWNHTSLRAKERPSIYQKRFKRSQNALKLWSITKNNIIEHVPGTVWICLWTNLKGVLIQIEGGNPKPHLNIQNPISNPEEVRFSKKRSARRSGQRTPQYGFGNHKYF